MFILAENKPSIMQRQADQIPLLRSLNEDLENYFANKIIPQLFVDSGMILRKFTPPAMVQFDLREEYIGKPMKEISGNFRHPSIIKNIQTVLRTGKILEKDIQTTDMRWYQMNILPCRVSRKDCTNGAILTFVDITNRIADNKAQEKLISEYELLLDTIAHDIKNPLFGIRLLCEQLLRTPSADRKQLEKIVAGLCSGITDLEGTVNGLLGARWQKERYEAATELIDLQSIIEDVKLALAPQIIQTTAVITQDLQAVEISFVRRKIRSILYNLLANAIKYTPKGTVPRIHISTSAASDLFWIRVSDNGIGMDKRDLQHVREKFTRISHTDQGAGVGLYLVNTIALNAGGQITIESSPGKGSTFTISLRPQ